MSLFGKTDVAIDIGPETSHVFVKARGVVFSGRTEELRAASGAKELPALISECLSRAGIRRGMFRPRIRAVLTVNYGIGEAEKQRFQEAGTVAGAKVVILIELPMACAIGAGMPVSEPRGSMIVDIRGDECQVAVISLAGIVAARDVCGCVTTSAAKDAESKIDRGDLVSREKIAGARKEVLAECAAKGLKNLVSDVLDRGAVVTGGEGVDEGLAKWLAENAGFPVKVADNAATAAVEGAGVVLGMMDTLAPVL